MAEIEIFLAFCFCCPLIEAPETSSFEGNDGGSSGLLDVKCEIAAKRSAQQLSDVNDLNVA